MLAVCGACSARLGGRRHWRTPSGAVCSGGAFRLDDIVAIHHGSSSPFAEGFSRDPASNVDGLQVADLEQPRY